MLLCDFVAVLHTLYSKSVIASEPGLLMCLPHKSGDLRPPCYSCCMLYTVRCNSLTPESKFGCIGTKLGHLRHACCVQWQHALHSEVQFCDTKFGCIGTKLWTSEARMLCSQLLHGHQLLHFLEEQDPRRCSLQKLLSVCRAVLHSYRLVT